jgi:hypothetical protein
MQDKARRGMAVVVEFGSLHVFTSSGKYGAMSVHAMFVCRCCMSHVEATLYTRVHT